MHHLDLAPAFNSTVTGPTGVATFSGIHDQLAFVYRRHFGVPKHTPPRPARAGLYTDRCTGTLVNVSTRRGGVPLVLWDAAEHDGDTISVLLNGEVVLDHYGLSHKHHRVDLPLNWGDNTALVVRSQRRSRAAQQRARDHSHRPRSRALVGEDQHHAKMQR